MIPDAYRSSMAIELGQYSAHQITETLILQVFLGQGLTVEYRPSTQRVWVQKNVIDNDGWQAGEFLDTPSDESTWPLAIYRELLSEQG